jgi:hypothetical protein
MPPGVHFGLPSSDVDVIISLGRPIDLVKMPNATQRPAAFTALVTGLQEALQETFWAARFGMVTDRFGIPWAINSEKA